jgi:hypothetical protein
VGRGHDVRVSVKGYLAILLAIFVVGLLAVSLVNRKLAGDLGGVLDDITHRNYPKATAARELATAKLTQQHALADYLLTAARVELTEIEQAERDYTHWRGELGKAGLDGWSPDGSATRPAQATCPALGR